MKVKKGDKIYVWSSDFVESYIFFWARSWFSPLSALLNPNDAVCARQWLCRLRRWQYLHSTTLSGRANGWGIELGTLAKWASSVVAMFTHPDDFFSPPAEIRQTNLLNDLMNTSTGALFIYCPLCSQCRLCMHSLQWITMCFFHRFEFTFHHGILFDILIWSWWWQQDGVRIDVPKMAIWRVCIHWQPRIALLPAASVHSIGSSTHLVANLPTGTGSCVWHIIVTGRDQCRSMSSHVFRMDTIYVAWNYFIEPRARAALARRFQFI